jgi:RNA polymerase sigma factor (sigma-70 family)
MGGLPYEGAAVVIPIGWLVRVSDVSDDSAIECEAPVTVVDSFDEFYLAQYGRVFGIAFALVGDRDRADDVTQDAFVSLHRRWDDVSRFDRPDLWVRRVAINAALSWRRRAATELRALTRIASRTAPGSQMADGGSAEVWRLVQMLPRAQAMVVVLVFVDDLTLEQAGRVLGIATPTAKTHLQRAKRKLAVWLNEEIDND